MRFAVLWAMMVPLGLMLVMGAGLALHGALHASWYWMVGLYLLLMWMAATALKPDSRGKPRRCHR